MKHKCHSYNDCFVSMFIGAVVMITPGFIVPVNTFPYPRGTAGLLFCHLIDTRFLIFMMGKASVLLVMCLAIERWFASVRPLQYRIRFTSKRLAVYITSIWISTCIFQLYRLFRKIPGEDGCRWAENPFGLRSLKALIISYVFVTFILPSAITWGSFLHIWLSVRRSPAMNTASGNQARSRLLRMCVLTAFFLTLCWFPDQLNYVLSLFHVTSLASPISDYFLVLALSNSWVNPWIYCLTNKAFRKDFRSLFTFRVFSRSRLCLPFKTSAYCLKDMKGTEDFKMTFGNPVKLSQYKLYV